MMIGKNAGRMRCHQTIKKAGSDDRDSLESKVIGKAALKEKAWNVLITDQPSARQLVEDTY
jgi:DNA-binding transcriptional regulator LsrR (DeoR family)